METRKLVDLADINKLRMEDFNIESYKSDTLHVIGHRGYPHYYWVDIFFIDVGYIICPSYFFFVRLRLATEQEIQTSVLKDHTEGLVYCFEEDSSFPGKEPGRFLISASRVEATVHHGGDRLDAILGPLKT